MCGVNDALRRFVTRTLRKCGYYYYYYFKLYNITTLVAKCQIESFRLTEGPEVCVICFCKTLN